MGVDPLQYPSCMDHYQGLIRDDDQVRPANDAPLINKGPGGVGIGENGRAPTLRTITRGILHSKAREEKSRTQNAAGGFFHALAAAAVKP